LRSALPTSKGSVAPNRKLAEAIAARIRKADPRRQVSVMATVTRKHPVESSCVRRRRGGRGLRLEDHAIIRTGRTPAANAACFFIDNVATEGTTLTACHIALGRGGAIVFADKHHP